MNELHFSTTQQRQEPRDKNETTLEFLTRDKRPEAAAIQQWMESWIRRFPVDHRAELKNRLNSLDFETFMSAYFELQVFAMLRLLDCKVEVHPGFDETSGTVDFGVRKNEVRFYVEATVCGTNGGKLRSNTNEEDVVHKIKQAIECPHSDVWLVAEGELRQSLGRDRVTRPIRDLLDSCTAADVRGSEDEYSWRQPRTLIQEGDWRLEVSLSPPIASDGKGQVRGPSRGGCVDGVSPVAKALSRKAEDRKNKRLREESFVIAINICHSEYGWDDERSATYTRADPIVGLEAFSRSLSPSCRGDCVRKRDFGNGTKRTRKVVRQPG